MHTDHITKKVSIKKVRVYKVKSNTILIKLKSRLCRYSAQISTSISTNRQTYLIYKFDEVFIHFSICPQSPTYFDLITTIPITSCSKNDITPYTSEDSLDLRPNNLHINKLALPHFIDSTKIHFLLQSIFFYFYICDHQGCRILVYIALQQYKTHISMCMYVCYKSF